MSWKFEIYPDAGDKYRWRLIASNGEKVAASGEPFDSKYNARRAAETVRDNAGKAEIVEV
jgi:hypothetical protein